ncbi:uncharacterized protein LOC142980389 isoform X2 [Anticarsia gemmatalis]|uniref:uncharacterized protein LOC142980389 isoform X2 n=1 Tax=Anticarsia gemmatalis TaxID=129554 RepID=UPI003F76417E
MESHGDIARPQQGAQGRIRAEQLWQELGELLNAVGSGVIKTIDKWKKVWTDWKAKTKKKALAIRRHADGTGGGPSSKQTLTPTEQRILSIMGLNAVVGQQEIDERGFDVLPQQVNIPPDNSATQAFSQTVPEDIVIDFVPSFSVEGENSALIQIPPPSQLSHLSPSQVNPSPPNPTTDHHIISPVATSPIPSTSRGIARRRRLATSPAPVPSPTTSTPRRRRLLRARTRRIRTPFDRATSEFVDVEHRRLDLEEIRERHKYSTKTESLRLEARRIEIYEKFIPVLENLTRAINNMTQNRTFSLPSTDILP